MTYRSGDDCDVSGRYGTHINERNSNMAWPVNDENETGTQRKRVPIVLTQLDSAFPDMD